MTHHRRFNSDPWLPPEYQDGSFEDDPTTPPEEQDDDQDGYGGDGYDDNGRWNDFPGL